MSSFVGLPVLVSDVGNWGVKSGSPDHKKETLSENAVAIISESQWNRAKRMGRMINAHYGYIKWRSVYYAIGNTALNYSYVKRMGKEKYASTDEHLPARAYYGLQVIAAAMRQWDGKLPSEIGVMCAHPPSDADQWENIVKAVKGRWKFEDLHGNKYDLNISIVDAVPEVLAGGLHQVLLPDGTRMKDALYAGHRQLIFDFGGGTVDVQILNDDGIPIPNTDRSERIGFDSALRDFKAVIDSEYAHIFNNEDGIPMRLVYAVASHKDKMLVEYGGTPLDLSHLWNDVMSSTMTQLYSAGNRMTQGLLLSAYAVIVTGGAGDIVFNELSETLFEKFADDGRLRLADARGQTIYANMRGLKKFVNAVRIMETKKGNK